VVSQGGHVLQNNFPSSRIAAKIPCFLYSLLDIAMHVRAGPAHYPELQRVSVA